jgi:hypothetical protein
MDLDQPAHPLTNSISSREIDSETAWILIRLRGSAGWSGSMLVANPLCWFCHDAVQISYIIVLYTYMLFYNELHISKPRFAVT